MFVYYGNHTEHLKNFFFNALKKYETERTNKLLPYIELCEQTLSYFMSGEVYIVQVLW